MFYVSLCLIASICWSSRLISSCLLSHCSACSFFSRSISCTCLNWDLKVSCTSSLSCCLLAFREATLPYNSLIWCWRFLISSSLCWSVWPIPMFWFLSWSIRDSLSRRERACSRSRRCLSLSKRLIRVSYSFYLSWYCTWMRSFSFCTLRSISRACSFSLSSFVTSSWPKFYWSSWSFLISS